MANTYQTLNSLFIDIADAIREVKGISETIPAEEFPSYIRQFTYISPAPTLAASNTWYKGSKSTKYFTTIDIVDSYTPSDDVTESWNADVNDTGEIKCYVKAINTYFGTLTIAGNGAGKIIVNEDASNLFYDFSNVPSINGLDILDTSNATNMSSMFNGCSKLTTLNVSNFNTNKVTDMSYMFAGCTDLTSLDLSNLDTSQVTNMRRMFSLCSSLTSLDLSSFNTSKVTDMSYMFISCTALTSLNVGSFNTSNVTNMSSMFEYFSNITTLDLSSFNTSKVTNMTEMFCASLSLTTIYASNLWDVSNVNSSSYMFMDCSNLQGDIAYDSSYVDKTYAKTSGGYLTYKAVA